MRRRRHENPISLFSFQDIITSVTGILILLALLLAIAVIQQKDAASPRAAEADAADLQREVAELESEVTRLQQIVSDTDSIVNSWSSLSANELRQEAATLATALKNYQDSSSRLAEEIQRRQAELQQLRGDPQFAQLVQATSDASRQLAEAKTKLEQLKSGQRIVYNFRSTTRQPWIAEVAAKVIRAAQPGQTVPATEFSSASRFSEFMQKRPAAERYVVLLVKPSGIHSYDAIRDQLAAADVELGTELIGEDQVAVDPQVGVEFE